MYRLETTIYLIVSLLLTTACLSDRNTFTKADASKVLTEIQSKLEKYAAEEADGNRRFIESMGGDESYKTHKLYEASVGKRERAEEIIKRINELSIGAGENKIGIIDRLLNELETYKETAKVESLSAPLGDPRYWQRIGAIIANDEAIRWINEGLGR
jgi:hypothetical protein